MLIVCKKKKSTRRGEKKRWLANSQKGGKQCFFFPPKKKSVGSHLFGLKKFTTAIQAAETQKRGKKKRRKAVNPQTDTGRIKEKEKRKEGAAFIPNAVTTNY